MTKAFDDEPRRGPFARQPMKQGFTADGREVIAGHPADPRQRVRNDRRTPEPFADLRRKPDLTGAYFERRGRFRLYINHVGEHLECMLTLVVGANTYHQERKTLAEDIRLPFDWGIAGYNTAVLRPSRKPPIAFRFAADFVRAEYAMYVPVWLGDVQIAPERRQVESELGFLEVRGSGEELDITFAQAFVASWPEVEQSFPDEDLSVDVTLRAVRDHRHPVLLDRYLARESVPFTARSHHWFELTPQQRDNVIPLAREIFTTRVRVHKDRAFLPSSDSRGTLMTMYDLMTEARTLGFEVADRIPRANIVQAVDNLVAKLFDKALVTPVALGGIRGEQLETMRVQVLRLLDAWQLEALDEANPERSVSSVLQEIINRNGGETNARRIEKFLKLKPGGWRTFRYKVDIELFEILDFETGNAKFDEATGIIKELLKEAAKQNAKIKDSLGKVAKYVPLTYMLGHMTVRYVGVVKGEPQPSDIGPWEASYGIALGGIKASHSRGKGGAKFTLKGTTDAPGVRIHRPEDLDGHTTYSEGSLAAGVAPDGSQGTTTGALLAKSMISFFGGLDEPALSVFFDAKLKAGTRGAAGSIKTLYGLTWLLDATNPTMRLEPEENGEEEKQFNGYWESRIPSLAVHFPINGARLSVPTPEELERMHDERRISVKEALNAFAACELPLIANPMARISLEGFADAPDKEERNLELSENRAETVFNYLVAVAGDRLTFGEDLDGLRLEKRVLLIGHGEAKAKPKTGEAPTSGKREGPEKFDPKLRKVTVSVAVFATPDLGARSITWPLIRAPR